jgi:signal transduction histidine kinase/ABC-type uncharacterized transport system substrate-binding protein
MKLRTRLLNIFFRRFMWKLLLCLHLALTMASPLLMTTASAEQPTKRVLIFSNYDSNLPGFVALNRALRSTVRDGSTARVEFFYEAQENTRIPMNEYEQELVSYLRRKYASEKFDLIITVGAPSLKFLSKHGAELFTDTPRLFFFYDEREELAYELWPNITGIWVKLDIAETLEMALALHPGTQRVFVVSGNDENNRFLREQAQSELQKYESKVEIAYPTNLTIEELKDTLAALPRKSLVLFLDFALDRAGNTFSGPEALSKIGPTSSAPIYGISDTYIGSGVVGGNVIDFDVIGARTGKMALRILADERPQDISPETVASLPVFDWRELRRWGISEDRLPPGNSVRFRMPSIWDEYKWYLLGIVFLILLQSAMISGLLINRSRRKRAEGQNQQLIHRLGERVKELTALHLSARILHDEARSVAELLQTIVSLLPPAWQYPEVTAARISFGDIQFETPNFSPTPWSQVAPFTVGNLDCAIEVVYLEARPEETNGPFLLEEKNLIESLAEMLNSALNRRLTQEQLRALSERLRKAKEEEGIRIARELHDELGGVLTSLKWSLTSLGEVYSGEAKTVSDGDARTKIEEMVGLIDATINTVRRISSELRPSMLDDLGLIAAIEWHAKQFQDQTGIICRFNPRLEHVDLSREQSTAIFRIFQEAMTNVLRHAQATKVNILIEEDEGELVFGISDLGRGITESEKQEKSSLGLLGMRERAHSIGARIEIEGIAGQGTTLIVRLPLSS